MGRKTFSHDAENLQKHLDCYTANGFVPRAHIEEDAIQRKHHRTDDTKQKQADGAKYEYEKAGYKIKPGCPAPDVAVIKDCIRCYIKSVEGRGRLSNRKVATVRPALAWAEIFFGEFEEATGSTIQKVDRDETYSWIKKTLTAEEKIEDIKIGEFDFLPASYGDLAASLWTRDSPVFIHGLFKIFMLFALQVCLLTGARIGDFIPENEHKDQRGLRFKHLELVLFRSPEPDEPWKVGFLINQQWFKKNRNPNYTEFGIGIRHDKKPQFVSGLILLVISLRRGALYGIDTLEDIAEYDLRDGPITEIPLRFKTEVLETPVLQNVTAEGPQEVPLTKERFCYFLRILLVICRYSNQPTIGDIRRNLGKIIKSKHGPAPVSQITGHRSASTYPEHYLAHCSSIDTVGDVLGEFWQGYKQFREPGLPTMPAAVKEKGIRENPGVVEIKSRIQDLLGTGDIESAESAKKDYRRQHFRLRLNELTHNQCEWFRERRDRQILDRGKGDPERAEENPCTRALALIMPELEFLGATMSSTEPLSFDQRMLFAQNILAHSIRDYDVVYLPNEAPVNGRCPVASCGIDIQQLERGKRSGHIHDCILKDKARNLQVAESKLIYCYECMTWCMKSEWHDHCVKHIQTWNDRHCEVISYRHTVIRPGYCPCCLWNESLPADDRLKYWLRSADLRKHIETRHIGEIEWPLKQSICGCPDIMKSESEFRFHLHDVHKLVNGIWKTRAKRKRAVETKSIFVDGKDEEPKPKKKPKEIRF